MSLTNSHNQAAYIRCLDGFRGLAAFWVLLVHCLIWGGNWVLPLPHNPKLPVDLFMLLSGFLMMERYADINESCASLRVAWLRFWMVRFFRIAPVYYLALILVFVFHAELQSSYEFLWVRSYTDAPSYYHPGRMHFDIENLAVHLGFVFGLFPEFAYATLLPDWSLSLEMQFYAIFPFLMLIIRKQGLAFISVLALALNIAFSWLGQNYPALYFPEPSLLPLRFNIFFAGILLASARRLDGNERLGRVSQALLIGFVLCREHSIVQIFAVLIGLCTISAEDLTPRLAYWRDLLCGILGCKVARWMSELSYSVYLVHGGFIAFVGHWLLSDVKPNSIDEARCVWLLIAITIVGSYSVGFLVHRLIERPGILLGRALVAKWLPASALKS